MMHRIFVYGTLKRGGRLHPALRGAKFLRDATISGRLYQKPGYWYPQAQPGDGVIHGELFGDVSDECLEGLDRAEGHPYLYRRTEITVAEQPAWVYWYMPDTLADAPLVPGGNFDVRGK